MYKAYKYVYAAVLLLVFFGCSHTPESLVEKRYENLNVTREIEVIHKNDNAAIILGKGMNNSCEEVEVVFLSKINEENEWKIAKLNNQRNCDVNATNEIKKRYMEWKKTR